ncbi:hypothetical protein [Empedobacter tilapiae]
MESLFTIVFILLLIGSILSVAGFILYLFTKNKNEMGNIEMSLKLMVWGIGIVLASGSICGLILIGN